MDLIKSIDTFIRVAHTGSFSAAAEQLHLAPSMVTRQIAALERHLKTQLLNRTTRRLSLTSAGELYLRQAKEIMNRVTFAAESLHATCDTPQGNIRFGMPYAFGLTQLMPIIHDFIREHPQVTLDLFMGEDCLDLMSHGLDMAVHVTAKLNDNLVAKRLLTSQRWLVASPEYLNHRDRPIHPRELTMHECLCRYAGEPWPFLLEGGVQELPAQGRLLINEPLAQRDAALAGMGIAYLPDYLVIPAIDAGLLERLMSDMTRSEKSISLVCPGPRYISQQVRAFAEYIVKRMTAIKNSQPYAINMG